MYYDYPEEEFYPESEYQEQIDALKEAIKNSVKSEILEEMNRLRAENEKLQGIKEHFEEVKRDYEKKKDECDRIIRNAEYNAKKMRLSELMKDHKVAKWKVGRELVYGPKCCKCNSNRSIEVRLPSGRIAEDECKCKTKSKYYYYENCDLAECEKYFHDNYPVRENRSVEVGKTYRHFKGKIVEVIAISQDTESPGQYYVVYKCEDGAIWSRPYGMFVGKVDRKKYPDADQEYRFEEVQNGHQE